ncbi:hypothetical protein EU537_08425 [Candidatus Thorarchaeota archaeon]|nr:MAG: hypothetical protein EU537_08425 [Candidatus Thorarchaeota archaeon]
MSGFYPISPLVGLTNTSYAAQAGVMNEKWACRVVRGKKILAEKTMPDLNLENFVGIIYGHIRVEGLSRHSVAMCAGRLMQFARRYQQSGVAPDFEVAGLIRQDGTKTGVEAPVSESTHERQSETPDVSTETPEPSELPSSQRITEIPTLSPLNPKETWNRLSTAFGILLAEIATYGATLPEGHLDAMFERAANREIATWTDAENPASVVTSFCEMMYSCSEESQFPLTGADTLTIEVSGCKLLQTGREIGSNYESYPVGYPCQYHEKIAEKIAEITGLNISVNTSSTGCVVQIELGN